MKEKKSDKVTINLCNSEKELFNLVAEKNPKADNNKATIIRELLIFGTAVFIEHFSLDSIKDFRKNMHFLIGHNEMRYKPQLEKFYNKLKGGEI